MSSGAQEKPQLVGSRLVLMMLGPAQDEFERQIIDRAAREIEIGESYLRDAAAGMPWKMAGADQCVGAVEGLVSAVRLRRQMKREGTPV